MTNKELMEDSMEENCFDNPTLEEEYIKTNIIFVQPNTNENESLKQEETFIVGQEYPVRPADNFDGSDKESTLDGIEEVSLGNASIRHKGQSRGAQNGGDKSSDNVTLASNHKSPNKKTTKEFPRSNSANIFQDEHIFWDLIECPDPNIAVVDPRSDLMRFLLSPPPRNVVVKCQLNKTKKKDKTMLFTKFIFSLQISGRDENDDRELLTLMAARSRKKTKTAHYLISTDVSEMKTTSSTIIGKMRGNIIGTEFRFHENTRPPNESLINNDYDDVDNPEDNVSEVGGPGSPIPMSEVVGVAFYKSTTLLKQRPRRIHVAIPCWDDKEGRYSRATCLPSDRNDLHNDASTHLLKNIEPTFSKEMKCFTLNFGGRATRTSVKNFALEMLVDDEQKRVYQFGKCKDHYIIDYTYPLSAFQAFAIGLSSCHRKLLAD